MWGESVNGTLLASQDRCVHRVSKWRSGRNRVELGETALGWEVGCALELE